jgi:hypothetical protein
VLLLHQERRISNLPKLHQKEDARGCKIQKQYCGGVKENAMYVP